jgi:hypothetical protein
MEFSVKPNIKPNICILKTGDKYKLISICADVKETYETIIDESSCEPIQISKLEELLIAGLTNQNIENCLCRTSIFVGNEDHMIIKLQLSINSHLFKKDER